MKDVFEILFCMAIGALLALWFICPDAEIVSEKKIIENRAIGEIVYAGYHYAYRVVIDSARTDSLNNWKK